MEIRLEFGSLSCDAELFDTPVAKKFAENMPYTVPLQKWGNELYGSIEFDCGTNDPVPEIPPGGIAFTNSGNYLCIFFGQRPAWPVEYIGQIHGESWKQLVDRDDVARVVVKGRL